MKIGVMDSGFGGLSVLNELINSLSGIDYVYYGDLKNSPYGTKSPEEIIKLTDEICKFFITKGTDAILVACNTATSAAIHALREKYRIPIFGMEPAIKPALLENPDKEIAVLATPLTLKEEKYSKLLNDLAAVHRVYPVACKELASIIDSGNVIKAKEYLEPIFDELKKRGIKNIVLGCTHYVLIKPIYYDINSDIKLYDGNAGTVRHIIRSLKPGGAKNETQLELYLNGGTENDFERAYNFLNTRNKKIKINACSQ